MKMEMNLQGVDSVLEVLHKLPAEVVSKRGGPVRRALRKGALVIREQAKANVPVRTGALRDAIIVTRGRAPKSGAKGERYIVWTGSTKRLYANTLRNRRANRVGKEYEVDPPQFYGKFLEYGTAKMPARPWLRPAVMSRGGEAIEVSRAELLRQIDRITKKLAASAKGKGK